MSNEQVRVSFVPNIAGDSPTREEMQAAIPIDGWLAGPLEFQLEPSGWSRFQMEDGRIVKYRQLPNGDVQILVEPGTFLLSHLGEITTRIGNEMSNIREFVEASGLNPMPESDDMEYDDDSTELPEQTMWVLEDGTSSPYGPIERQLREDVGTLKLGGHLSKTLVETAYALARELDHGAKMATAAVAKQLREYVTEIERLAGDDDDTRSHNADLSSPV